MSSRRRWAAAAGSRHVYEKHGVSGQWLRVGRAPTRSPCSCQQDAGTGVEQMVWFFAAGKPQQEGSGKRFGYHFPDYCLVRREVRDASIEGRMPARAAGDPD